MDKFDFFAQAVVFISTGAIADHGSYRKLGLMITAIVGSLAVMAWIVTGTGALWWLAGCLYILANVAHGASIVFYNGEFGCEFGCV